MTALEEAHRSSVGGSELRQDVKKAIQEITTRMDRNLKFDSPEELEVVKENFNIAKKRSMLGFVSFGAVSALGWKLLVGRKNVAFVAASGAFMGMTYGMFSVREDFFLDMLSIPHDKSPFASTAHGILKRQLPAGSVVFQEIRRRQRILFPAADATDQLVWNEGYRAPPAKDSIKVEKHIVDASGEHSGESESPSPFAFGGLFDAPPASPIVPSAWPEDEEELRRSKDVKPTTWDEIRRRAGRS